MYWTMQAEVEIRGSWNPSFPIWGTLASMSCYLSRFEAVIAFISI